MNFQIESLICRRQCLPLTFSVLMLVGPASVFAQAQPLAIFAGESNRPAQSKVIEVSGSQNRITGRVHANSDVYVGGSGNYFRTGVVEHVTGIYPTPNFQGKATLQGSSVIATGSQPYPVNYQLSDFAPGGAEALAAQAAGKYFQAQGDTQLAAFIQNGVLREGLYYIQGKLSLGASGLRGKVTLVATGEIEISGSTDQLEPFTRCLLAFSGKQTSKHDEAALKIGGSSSRLEGVFYAPRGGVEVSGSDHVFPRTAFVGRGIKLNGSNLELIGLNLATCNAPATTNQPPVVDGGADQSITLPVNTVALAGAVSDDALPAGAPLTVAWSLASGPGVVTFGNPSLANTTATFAEPGVYVLRLTAHDTALTNSDEVIISVNRENLPPVAFSQSLTHLEDTPVDLVLTGDDPDDDTLSFVVVSQPSFGALSGTPPAVRYTPNPDYFGSDSFAFKVSDGLLESALANVALTVLPVNDPPVAEGQTLATPEDTPLVVTLTGSDMEGSALTFILITSPTNGTLTANPATFNQFTYTPSPEYYGPDSFTFKVNDGSTDSAPTNINLNVISVNDAPLVSAGIDRLISLPTTNLTLVGSVSDDYYTPYLFTLWSKVSGPGTVTFSDDTATNSVATFGAPGVYVLELTADDGFVIDTDEVVVTVNAPPAVNAGADQTNTLPNVVTLLGAASDDGLPTSSTIAVGWSKASGPGTVVFADPSGTNTTATFSESGIYVLRLRADDSLVTVTDEVSILINKAPIVDAGADQTNAFPTELTLHGAVIDDGLPTATLTITWSKVSGPGTVAFGDATQPLTTATFDLPGLYTLRLTASDSLATVSREVTVILHTAPLVSAGTDQTIDEGQTAALSGSVTDDGLPGGLLTATWTQISGPGTVSFADEQALNTTATFSEGGSYVLRLTADDGHLSASDEVTLTVNRLPHALTQAFMTLEDTALALSLNGSDPDGDTISFTIETYPTRGTLNGTPPALEYVPFPNHFGPDSFTFKVNDGRLTSDPATVSINVLPVNDAPIALAQSVSTDEDVSIGIILTGTDPEGDSLSFEIVTPPAHGTLSGTAPDLSYEADPNYHGSDSFTFIVNDGQVDSAEALVAITINPVNDPPLVDAGPDQTVNQTVLQGANLLANPGNESVLVGGNIPDWVEAVGTVWTKAAAGSSGRPAALEGLTYFHPGSVTQAELRQDVSCLAYASAIDAGAQLFQFKGYVRVKDEIRPDSAQIVIEYRDAGNSNVLEVVTFPPCTTSSAWILQADRRAAPPGTRSIRIRLIGTRNLSDSTCDSFFDELALNAVESTVVSLAGQATDDGAAPTVAWEQISGPTLAFINPTNTPASMASLPLPGDYALRLFASDAEFTVHDDVQITVNPLAGNQPPLVDAGSDQTVVLPHNSVVLSGSVTDDGNPSSGVLRHSWTKVGGDGGVTFSDPASLTPTAFFDEAGIYRLRLSADDGERVSSDEVEVLVQCASIVQPMDVVLVIDHSGSMSAGTQMADARNAAIAFVNTIIPLRDLLWVVQFDNTAQTLVRRSNHKAVLTNAIASIIIAGGTAIDAGIQAATTELLVGGRGSNATPVILLLSDGGSDFNLATNAAGLARAAGIRIISIGLGAGVDDRVMKAVASSPGDYHFVPDSTTLPTLFSRLAAAICRSAYNNTPPFVDAGPERAVRGLNTPVALLGTVADDGFPPDVAINIQWDPFYGSGSPSFTDITAPDSSVSFDQPGEHVVLLSADDTYEQSVDGTRVRVNLPCQVLPPVGLVGWWTGNGTYRDMVSRQPASPHLLVPITNGFVATAFSFDGINNLLSVPSTPQLDVGAGEGFTVEFWTLSPVQASRSVFGWGSSGGAGVGLYRSSSGGLGNFSVNETNGTVHNLTFAWPSAGVWHHVAGSYDRASGLARVYVDGVNVANAAFGSYQAATIGDLVLGWFGGQGNFYQGLLDEVSVYNRALNPQEVHEIFAAGSVGKCPVDINQPPLVYAGPDRFLANTNTAVNLDGEVFDDDLPAGSTIQAQWSKFGGPGNVSFADPASPVTTAVFDAPGIYVLQLTADDGSIRRSDLVEVRVGALCSVEDIAGLKAWWPANGSSADVFSDQSGVLANGASYTTGKVALAFRLDGAGDYVGLKGQGNLNVGQGTNGFSIELWVRSDTTSGNRGVLSWNSGGANGVFLQQLSGSTGNLLVGLPETNGTAHTLTAVTGVFNGATWRHVAVTYDRTSGQARVYVDGVIQLTQTVGSYTPQTSFDLFAGQMVGVGTFAGQIDEVSLYNRPLNPQEVYEAFSSGAAGHCPLDDNAAPVVFAGPDQILGSTNDAVQLTGQVVDDGLPNNILQAQWTEFGGPGNVSFTDPTALLTTATFDTPGVYVLQLTADDTAIQRSDVMEIRVAAPCTALDVPELAAWWPANGTTLETLNGPAGMLINGASYVTGKVATAFKLDGANDYVWLKGQGNLDIGQGTNGFSIELWVRSDTTSGNRGVLSWNRGGTNGVFLQQVSGSTGNLLVGLPETNGTAHTLTTVTGVFNGATWRHVAVTYDRATGQARVYVDGLLRLTQAVGSYTPQTSFDLFAGQMAGLGTFAGQIDEVSLYTRPLALSEIQAIFNAGSFGKCVSPRNEPPTVSAGPDRTIEFPTDSVTLTGAAFDDGLPASNTLSVVWNYIAGTSTVFFSSTNATETTVTFTNTGVYLFELSASDGEFTVADTVTVIVMPDPRTPPAITITSPADESVVEVPSGGTTNLTLTASASDSDGAVTQVEFFQNDISLGADADAPYSLVASNLAVGSYTFTAVATDNDGLSRISAPVHVTVYVDQGPPIVAILSPADGKVVTAPTDIVGTASSPILESYQVLYRLKSAESIAPAPWAILRTGSASVVSNTLATFDPTLRLNGIYEIQLTATDTVGRTGLSETTTLIVDRNLKIGHFTISFSDLTVPVAGVPIEIVRTYDSRDQRTSDFGVGWSLDIRNVRLQKSRNLGPNWYEDTTGGFFPTYSIDPVKARRLSVTLADGRVFKFNARMSPTNQFGVPINAGTVIYEPTADTYGTLVSMRGDDVLVAGSIPGYVDLFDVLTGGYYNPTLFKLTTEDGDTYIIDELDGLKSLADRNGNTLLVSTNGVVWTNVITGGPALGVTFQRDPQGRISRIIDPQGNALNYAYGTNGSLATFTDRETNTTMFAYTNAAFPHYLTEITDPRGVKAIRTEFDASGRMVRQVDGAGNVVEFTHDLANNREIVRDRLGNVTIHEYDERGNVTRTTDALGHVTTFKFDGNDSQLEVVDALGNTNRTTYDSKGNKLTETDPLGYTTRYTYGQFRELTSVTNPRGFFTTNSYDPDTGNLLQERDALGQVTSYTYDGQGNLRTRADALGNVMTNAYDSKGRMVFTATLNAQLSTLNQSTFSYDTNGNQLTKSVKRTTTSGVETLLTHYAYDRENRLVQTFHPDGSTNTTVYALGLDKPAVEIDSLGRQMLHFYDARGNLTNTVYPDLTTESWSYDAENRQVAMTDKAGRLMTYGYDPLARMTNTVFADGSSSNVVYDAIGRITATKDERGNTTRFGYDPNCGCSGRQAFITNALGQVTLRSYDENANESSMTDALGRTTTFLHDELDRRTYTLFADGSWSLSSYDAIGRRIAETDQSTNTTWFGYDGLGRLTAVTNALGHVTRYTYDEAGSLIAQTDANNHTTTYEYDAMGRRVKRTLPGLQVETYAYDLAGNLTNKVDFNGRTTLYAYDALNRLTNKTPDVFFAAPPVAFTYTATGQRATMSDASGLTTYDYDLRDRLRTKATPQGTLVYSNDAAGNVTFIGSLNANGVALTYTYDALNRLETATEAHTDTTTYGYDAVGNLQGYVYPNDVASTYTYDALNRLTNLATLNPQLSTVASYRYTVAPSGHRLTASENVVTTNGVNTINRIYSYDATYRLVNESYSVTGPVALPPAANVAYTLDDVGNRLTRTSTLPGVNGQGLAYDANDRLTTDTYDANGNTTAGHIVQSAPTVSDAYDFEDRLINRNNGQVTVIYDGDGNRVSKTVGGVTTLFLVDDRNPSGYAQVLEELTSSSQLPTPVVTRVYAYGHDLISQHQLLEDGNGGFAWVASFYAYDGHGNVRYLNDEDGDVTDTYDYDAYGTLIAQTGSTPNSYLYCGEQFDADLGLYYNRARYLNTDSGRFWTRDVFQGSTRETKSLHKYLYAEADGANGLDPLGMMTLSDALGRLGIDKIVNRAAGQLLKNAARRQAKKIGCEIVKDQVVSGIYVIVLDGALYVGQSGNIAQRIAGWQRQGAKFVGAISVTTGMPKGAAEKFVREMIEQVGWDLIGGPPKGKNNPINPDTLDDRWEKHDPVNKIVTKSFKLIPMCKEVKE